MWVTAVASRGFRVVPGCANPRPWSLPLAAGVRGATSRPLAPPVWLRTYVLYILGLASGECRVLVTQDVWLT